MDYWDDELEWDDEKNRRNRRAHGVDFETATHVFDDERGFEGVDDRQMGALLSVVYVMRGERKRLISARFATPAERREYAKASPR